MQVSVVVPIYNCEKFVKRCVDSILTQTYMANEVILVDDGSTDSSGLICDECQKQYPQIIKVIHKKNGGLSDARNVGLENVNSEYVAFVDADDYISEFFLETLSKNINETKAEIACCGYYRTDGISGDFTIKNEIEVKSGEEVCMEMLRSSDFDLVTAWAKIIKTDIANKYKFPKGRLHEDVATTFKYYLEASKVVVNKSKLYAYYINENGIQIGDCSEKRKSDALWAHFERARELEKKGYTKICNKAWQTLALQVKELLLKDLGNRKLIRQYYSVIIKKPISTSLKVKIIFLYKMPSLIVKLLCRS